MTVTPGQRVLKVNSFILSYVSKGLPRGFLGNVNRENDGVTRTLDETAEVQ